MKKEKSLTEKIASYSAMAAGILAISKPADAQVIYTDVIPDTTVQNGTYGLDLNNDGVTDFNLTHAHSSSVDAVIIAPQGSNAFVNEPDTISVGSYVIPLQSPDTLNLGDTINANMNWQQIIPATSTSSGQGTTSFLMGLNYPAYSITVGNWFDAGEHFLGLKFKIGTANYYGWARIILGETANQFTLKDYAYYADSNKSILAGQMFTDGVNEIKQPETPLYNFYVQENRLTVTVLKPEIIGGNLEVMNVAGQLVYESIVEKNEFVLNLQNLPSGIYIIRAGKNENFQTNKILIKR